MKEHNDSEYIVCKRGNLFIAIEYAFMEFDEAPIDAGEWKIGAGNLEPLAKYVWDWLNSSNKKSLTDVEIVDIMKVSTITALAEFDDDPTDAGHYSIPIEKQWMLAQRIKQLSQKGAFDDKPDAKSKPERANRPVVA
ncbi:MAG: hypothetical protein SO360_01900 [Bifidobacterium tsurumiense]|uniref:hypothetical protein n=1 Tax=Bifidobacterium tsurumiense TaxID=356829 RepID=UPI002A83D27A|nr:hypothetical protein [Bifidobacterium tsurumiense]MDY4677606.1 hypothetical protein [Bifidobacterium tsurumiense]